MKIKAQFGALMVFLYASSCSNQSPKMTIAEYPVIQPKIQSTSFQIKYVAEINAIENIEVRSRVDGVIEQILVDEGEFVNKGRILVKIESSSFEQELKKAEAILASRLADLKAINIELQNAQRLYNKGIISKTELELTEARENAASANVNEAKGNVAQCELNLSYTKIKAPFSGRINRILLKRGSLANQETLITTLSNDKEVFAYFNLNESDYLSISKSIDKKNPIKVQLELSDGATYSRLGKIELAESQVDRVTGNIALKARFENSDGLIKHGSSGKIIWSKNLENAMLIPKQSTFEVQELTYVYVIDKNGVAKQRSININGQLPLYYAVESGLKPDEWILFEGVQMVSNNDQIKVKQQSFPNLK
jgi:membrane fusion protein (multidrug efflux system)